MPAKTDVGAAIAGFVHAIVEVAALPSSCEVGSLDMAVGLQRGSFEVFVSGGGFCMRVAFVAGERLRAGIQRLADLGFRLAVVLGDAMGFRERCKGQDGERGEYASWLQEANKNANNLR